MMLSEEAKQYFQQVENNFRTIKQRIAQACQHANRSVSEVTIIAATKKQPIGKLECAAELGIANFAENYAQELIVRSEENSLKQINWHFIGHLQSNKIRPLLEHCQCIHTLASTKHADRIERIVSELKRPPVEVFIEVNIAEEPQKSGVSSKQVAEFARYIEQNCPSISLQGLMAIPPQSMAHAASLTNVPAEYCDLAKAAQDICENGSLSLGMSNDLEAAIVAGSTHIRVGTALLGARKSI